MLKFYIIILTIILSIMTENGFSNQKAEHYRNDMNFVTINDTLFRIEISNNGEQFPSFIFNFSSLKTLHLYDSYFVEIPEDISVFQQLEELLILRCRDINYKDLYKKLSKLGNLKELKLINDSINCFDEELLNFPNLSLLELEDNQISEIPYYLFNLKNLNSIGISGNMITTITVPNEIDTSIKYLNLENNRLTMIPKGLENLKGLLLLYLGNNDSLNLEEICNLIPSLPNLEWMDIRNIRKRIHTPLPKNIANLAKVKRIVHLSTSDFTKEELIEMEKLGIKLPKAKTDW